MKGDGCRLFDRIGESLSMAESLWGARANRRPPEGAYKCQLVGEVARALVFPRHLPTIELFLDGFSTCARHFQGPIRNTSFDTAVLVVRQAD